MCVCVWMYECVHVCVCVRACVHACVCLCVFTCVLENNSTLKYPHSGMLLPVKAEKRQDKTDRQIRGVQDLGSLHILVNSETCPHRPSVKHKCWLRSKQLFHQNHQHEYFHCPVSDGDAQPGSSRKCCSGMDERWMHG